MLDLIRRCSDVEQHKIEQGIVEIVFTARRQPTGRQQPKTI
jgi:hypothetical protein